MKHRHLVNYESFLTTTLKAWLPEMERMLDAPRPAYAMLFAEPKGRRGPVTFDGTPNEVIQKFRRWQKGLKP